ncbi:AMP-binding protein [Gracilimonas sp. Q87]|uniref:AMP-binding protein n=1 Tax=Gracilimonas sp. Q87 TaxID=3384766 RepID=UPI0039841385
MNYKELKVPDEPKRLFKEIIESEGSCIIIPPHYRDRNPEVPNVSKDRKYVGLFSSGTTGKPKSIWNTFENIIQNAIYTSSAFEIKSEDTLLMLASPWHVAGLSWAMMAEHVGNEYRFITTNRGDEEKWYRAIHQFKPDVLLTVPAVLRSLMKYEWKLSKLVYGGTPVEPRELKALSKRCAEVFQGYGQTEAGGLICAHKFGNIPDVISDEHRCCGQPVKGVQVRCNGTIEKSEPVIVRSETAFTEEFYKTGDLGYKDHKGDLYIHSRTDKSIKDK